MPKGLFSEEFLERGPDGFCVGIPKKILLEITEAITGGFSKFF